VFALRAFLRILTNRPTQSTIQHGTDQPRRRFLTAISGIVFMPQPGCAISIEPGKHRAQSITIQEQDARVPSAQTVHYMLYTPRDYVSSEKSWPLLLFLHGLGECGNNELERVNTHGPSKLAASRPDFPLVVVTPQCPPPPGAMNDVPRAWRPELLIQLVDHVAANMRIDASRVYVTGLSMGGYGTWRLVAAYPHRFAAAVPVCGGGEPQEMAAALRGVPIWAFHGARDAVVPLSESQAMVDAVRNAGGQVRFTVYPEAEHDAWTTTYNNPDVYEWLLSHRVPLRS
jgi:predicted peptidase